MTVVPLDPPGALFRSAGGRIKRSTQHATCLLVGEASSTAVESAVELGVGQVFVLVSRDGVVAARVGNEADF